MILSVRLPVYIERLRAAFEMVHLNVTVMAALAFLNTFFSFVCIIRMYNASEGLNRRRVCRIRYKKKKSGKRMTNVRHSRRREKYRSSRKSHHERMNFSRADAATMLLLLLLFSYSPLYASAGTKASIVFGKSSAFFHKKKKKNSPPFFITCRTT